MVKCGVDRKQSEIEVIVDVVDRPVVEDVTVVRLGEEPFNGKLDAIDVDDDDTSDREDAFGVRESATVVAVVVESNSDTNVLEEIEFKLLEAGSSSLAV